jgi:hypothetical protein
MEFWRTDEVAPVVLIILFELMVFRADQLHDANLMPVMEFGCTHSGLASRPARALSRSTNQHRARTFHMI